MPLTRKILQTTFIAVIMLPVSSWSCNWDALIWDGENWRLETGTVTGHVATNVTGKTSDIVGASVSIDGTDLKAVTDSEGNYTITNVPSGTQTLRIEKENFETLVFNVQISSEAVLLSADDMKFDMGLKGDIDNNSRIGLEEAVYALQSVAGLRSDSLNLLKSGNLTLERVRELSEKK